MDQDAWKQGEPSICIHVQSRRQLAASASLVTAWMGKDCLLWQDPGHLTWVPGRPVGKVEGDRGQSTWDYLGSCSESI